MTVAPPCHPDDLLALRAFGGNLTPMGAIWPSSGCYAWDGVVCYITGRVATLHLPAWASLGG